MEKTLGSLIFLSYFKVQINLAIMILSFSLHSYHIFLKKKKKLTLIQQILSAHINIQKPPDHIR